MVHAGARVVPRPPHFEVAADLYGQPLAVCAGHALGLGVELHRQLRRVAMAMARAGLCAAPIWLEAAPPCLVWHEMAAATFTTEAFEAACGPRGTGRVLTPDKLVQDAIVGVGRIARPVYAPEDARAWYEADRVPLVLTHWQALTTPVPIGGKRGGGLWQVPPDVERAMQQQIGATG
jgi:hypothetical protein